MAHETGKPFGEVAAELKEEFKQFVSTRVQMFQVEMRDKLAAVKSSIPLLIVAALFGVTAFGVFTFALIAGLMTLFESQYAWLFASLIVFGLYAAIGGVLGWMGYRELTAHNLAPTRTLNVLRQDQAFLANEARRAA